MKNQTITITRGLARYLIAFNGRKIYTQPDSAAQTAAVATFIPPIESEPRKPFLTRFLSVYRRFKR